MSYLSNGCHYIDALCISEPWIHAPEEVTGLNIPGYTEILSLRSRNYVARPHGGLILYLRNSLYGEVTVLQDYMGSRHDVIWMRFRGVTWGFVYLPPATSSHVRGWDKDIVDALAGDMSLNNPPYILIGDFNAHIMGEVNARGRGLLRLMADYDLICLNDDTPTYCHAGANTIIDLLLVSRQLKPNIRFMVGDLSPESFHTPLHLILNSKTLPADDQKPDSLSHRRPPPPPEPTVADQLMGRLLDKAVKNTAVEGRVDFPRLEEDSGMSYVRRRLRALGKRHMSPDTMTEIATLRRRWKVLSNKKVGLRRRATQARMWEIRGRKGYWNHINDLRRKKTGIGLKCSLVEKHFKGLLDSATMQRANAEEPASYYSNMGLPPMDPPALGCDELNDDNVLKPIPADELLSHPFTSAEISFALSKLSNSAKGEDDIKVSELRSISSNDIAQFFIDVMDSYEIPTCWNRAILVPIPKKGVPTKPSELRGIAIQPALRRLFAACLARRLHRWCDVNNLLPAAQSGFRPGFRTTENVFVLRCLMERCMHEKQALIGISVDIEKAFDMVNRKILWAKLDKFGAVGALMDVVKLMYADPMLTLKMNSRFSDFMVTRNGVLQGCPLSPLLFICYLSDIPITSWSDPVLNGMRVSGLMLADDLMLFATTAAGADNKLSILRRYLSAHGMRLNAGKSWAANLTLHRGVDPDVWCDGTKIPMGNGLTYNGWKLDVTPRFQAWQSSAHLDFRYSHSLSVAQSLMSLVRPMNVPTSALSTGLYRSLVEPELIYACESSFDGSKAMALKYDRLQLKFLRFCLGLPSYVVGELVLWDCGHLALSARRLQLTARFFAHVAALRSDRIAHHALRDSMALATKGWFFALVKRLDNLEILPALDNLDDIAAFPARLDLALKRRQWEQVSRVSNTRSTLRSLNWSPVSRTLQKATYLKLPRHLVRAIARLRFGANNLAVHRMAWENVEWEDRLCICGEVESECHVLCTCGLFSPERMKFLDRLVLEDGYEDCKEWEMDRFMRFLVSPKTVGNARLAGRFLREVWEDIDSRYTV